MDFDPFNANDYHRFESTSGSGENNANKKNSANKESNDSSGCGNILLAIVGIIFAILYWNMS